MSRPRNIVPPVREKPRGSYVELRVWFEGKWRVVGRRGDEPSDIRSRIMAIIANVPPKPKPLPRPEGLTIARLFAAYLLSPSAPLSAGDRATIKRAGIMLAEFCGANAAAAGLASQQLSEWQDWLCNVRAREYLGKKRGYVSRVNKRLSQQYITRLVSRVKRVYRWGGKKLLVPAHIAAELESAEKLKPGRARLRPTKNAITPAEYDLVMPMLQVVPADMLRVQRAAGMRAIEVCRIRPCEVKRSGKVVIGDNLIDLDSPDAGGIWLWVPEIHKTLSAGGLRIVALPKSIHALLTPYLDRDPQRHCFSPIDQEQRRGRKIRVGKRAMRDHYTSQSYTRALQYGCRRAGVPPWTATQIRKLAIMEVARDGGARQAQIFAGHVSLATTSKYLSFDQRVLFAAAAGR
jgi:integrase